LAQGEVVSPPPGISQLHSAELIVLRRMNATHDSLLKFDRCGRLRYTPGQKDPYSKSKFHQPDRALNRRG
jgi:hypothetical protein